MVNDNRKHLNLSRVADSTSSDLSDNSFVNHNLGKLDTRTREIKPDKSECEAARNKRTASDQSTKSVDNKKHRVVVVDLTIDDSDDDDSGCHEGDLNITVGDTKSTGGNISGSRGNAVNDVSSGVGVNDGVRVGVGGNSNDRGVVGMSNGIIGAGSVGVSSRVGVNDGVRVGVSRNSNVRGVVGISNGISGAGSVGVGSGVGVNDGVRVCVSRNSNDRGVVGISNGISGVGSVGVGSGVGVNDGVRVGVGGNSNDRGVVGSGDRVGVSSDDKGAGLSGVGTVGHVADDTTFPKILAAYSLNHSELRDLLRQKSKENVVKANGVVVNGSAATLSIGPNAGMVTEAPRKNGFTIQPKNDVSHQPTLESIAHNRNDVINDVTKLRNGNSRAKKLDPTQKVFSWSDRHDSNLDSVRRDQGGDATFTDSEDQVIITKVVTSTEKSHGRKRHPRKAPVEVRKLFLEEKSPEPISSTVSERDVIKRRRTTNNTNVGRREKRSLEETIASLNGTINGTPWSFTMKPDVGYRENKIRDLKQRLALQEEAVEKLRSKGGVNRVLVVQIPDLKKKLGIQSEKKQSFRVFDQKDACQSAKGLANKRKRKTLPKKVSREADSDSDCSGSYRAQKRTRVGKGKIRRRLPRQTRGRSFSPTIRKAEKIVPVVRKDLWHREMEKVEAELASSNRAMDKTAFLLFLGLKKVEAM